MTREPEWDDDTRDQAFEFTDYLASICGCGCGLPVAESHDPHRAFKIHTVTCYARRAIDKVQRDQDQEHKNDTDGVWASGKFLYAEPGDVIAGPEHDTPLAGAPRKSRIERMREALT